MPIDNLDPRRHAPELLDEQDDVIVSKASDVWAFACTAYEIFTGRVPYYRFTRLWRKWIDAMERGLTPEWYEGGEPLCDIPDDLRVWIDKRWTKNPDERGDMGALAVELDDYLLKIKA